MKTLAPLRRFGFDGAMVFDEIPSDQQMRLRLRIAMAMLFIGTCLFFVHCLAHHCLCGHGAHMDDLERSWAFALDIAWTASWGLAMLLVASERSLKAFMVFLIMGLVLLTHSLFREMVLLPLVVAYVWTWELSRLYRE